MTDVVAAIEAAQRLAQHVLDQTAEDAHPAVYEDLATVEQALRNAPEPGVGDTAIVTQMRRYMERYHGGAGVVTRSQGAVLEAIANILDGAPAVYAPSDRQATCSQCGQPFTARACGPTHAMLAAAQRTRPEVVVLCGSTRFFDQFQQANYDLTMEGKIVLSVGFYPHAVAEAGGHGEGVGHDSAEKVALDELHLRKIDLADWVYVLNVGGYVGDSTRREIDYAVSHGKPIHWLVDPEPTA